MERRMELESTLGLMELSTKDNGRRMRLQVMASTNGRMEGDTWVTGKVT